MTFQGLFVLNVKQAMLILKVQWQLMFHWMITQSHFILNLDDKVMHRYVVQQHFIVNLSKKSAKHYSRMNHLKGSHECQRIDLRLTIYIINFEEHFDFFLRLSSIVLFICNAWQYSKWEHFSPSWTAVK